MLDLLGIDSGVIALTKIDAVGPSRLTMPGEGRPTADGYHAAGRADPPGLGQDGRRNGAPAGGGGKAGGVRHGGSRPRLWVDRAFSVRGAGMVVTGTLTEGSLRVGDHLELLPGRKPTRIRGMQSHEKDIEVADPVDDSH